MTEIYGGDVSLTVMMPAGLMRQLAVAAANDLRTTEAEALWLIRDGLTRKDTGIVTRRSAQGRLEDAEALFAELASAYTEAGRPSTRQIAATAREQGHSVSHTTVHDTLARKRVPSWQVIEAIAAGLGTGNVRFKTAFAQIWEPDRD